jgi:hypothetical protein
VSYTIPHVTTDPREIARLRREETAGAAPLYAARPVVMLGPDHAAHLAPVAFVNTRRRPDVGDLWRLLRQEPDRSGDAITAWRVMTQRGSSQAVLNIHWTAPVDLHLRLVFSVKAHHAFLALAAASNLVALSCTPPAAHTSYLETISVCPEGDVLRAALPYVAQLERTRR